VHPLDPLENCYRWAGETDVLEAIEAVVRNYAIDRERIVLCGMSMGASGTWHLGPKHPDRFVALGPYCRYVDTQDFVQTPLANFVKIGPLPAHQEKALHMLDSVGYAANACVIPAVETWTSDVRSSCPELPRLERGTFALPTASDASVIVTPTQSAVILGGLDPAKASKGRRSNIPASIAITGSRGCRFRHVGKRRQHRASPEPEPS